MNKKIKLPSGAELEITLAPFADARDLQQVMAANLKGIHVTKDLDVMDANFMKDIVLTSLSSSEIIEKLEVCMTRCTYNGLRIDKDTFEPEKAREDYFSVLLEVTKANIGPFLKGLFAQFKMLLKEIPKLQ